MASGKRLFVALELPNPIRAAIAEYFPILRPSFPHARWVDPAALHLTLKFLGQVHPETIAELFSALQESLRPFPPLPIMLGRLGGVKHRVLWVECAPLERLQALQEGVEQACSRLGFPREKRPFRPHITLARMKGNSPAGAWANPWGADFEKPKTEFTVKEGVLLESVLKPGGPEYRTVQRFFFEGGD